MLINVTKLIDLIKNLQFELDDALAGRGKTPSQVKVRIDCVLKALYGLCGTCVPGSRSDFIVEVPYESSN